jgi:glycosyltransferase involved in cell wall biosynthesis
VRLGLVVPATDAPATLARCLEAVRRASDTPDHLVVVATPPGAGPAAARNAGAREAACDVLVFVDADVLVHADAFVRIREAFASDPELVALFGSYDDTVATRGAVAAFRNMLHHVVHQRSAGEVSTFWAGLGAVRAGTFAAVGGFDEGRYPRASIEDIELGGRLADRGRVVLDPALRGTHLKEWTLWTMVQADFARRGVPWITLMAERRSVPTSLNLGVRERASALTALATVGALLARRPALAAAALGAGVALNVDLYRALGRRLGTRGVVAGVPLHVLHQLVGAASVPAGLAVALRRRPR